MMESFKLSARSIKNLEGVDPMLISVVYRALELSNIDFGITEGVRSVKKQKELFHDGLSKTMSSFHLTGDAVDVVAYIDGHISWEWSLYEKIAKAFKQAAGELGVLIEWGGDWKNFKDGTHFQIKHIRKIYKTNT